MTLDPYALKIYIDGSSLKNPGGASGFAGRAEYPEDWNRPDEVLFSTGYKSSTNNRMELLACVTAMEHVRDNVLGVQRVQIVTDSRYVHDNIPRAERWRHDHWKNRYGRPIENDDLWQKFLSVRQKLRIRTDFIWLKGKKSPTLKAIDADAKGASRQPWERDFGFREGKVGRSKIRSGRTAAVLLPAAGQESVIHVYRKRLVNSVDCLDFDVWDNAVKAFTAKARAYADPSLGIDLHRGHIYQVRFNDDPHYPKIVTVVQEIRKES